MAFDVKTLCLGVLAARGSASGYEIRKAFEDGPFSNFADAGFGSIYPSLKALAAEQLVVEETSTGGRADKKVYRITPDGRQALFDKLTAELPAPDKLRSDFLFTVIFGHQLPPRHLDAVIDRRIAYLRSHISELRTRDPRQQTPGERFARGYDMAVSEAALSFLEDHRHEIVGAAFLERQITE